MHFNFRFGIYCSYLARNHERAAVRRQCRETSVCSNYHIVEHGDIYTERKSEITN